MKYLLASILFFASCKKDCAPANAVCNEKPPTNEACTAYFTTWFFNASTNSCTQIGYSGCSPKGFATKEECEACKCN